jgi:hypothetical protein
MVGSAKSWGVWFWLAGGISGLYHAMTGEHLPGGRLEAVAEGNALGKGPVVFEVHHTAIDVIRKLAAGALPIFLRQRARIALHRAEARFAKAIFSSYSSSLQCTLCRPPYTQSIEHSPQVFFIT